MYIISPRYKFQVVNAKNTINKRHITIYPKKSYKTHIKIPKAFEVSQTFLDSTYYVGKYITLFTMFYSGLNWLHYRNLQNMNKNENDKKDDDDKY
jgi:hypothetical protein